MLKAKGIVTWIRKEDGGLDSTPFSGIQPSFRVSDDLIISRIFRADGQKEMQPGTEYEVSIELPYGERYRDHIVRDKEFTLNIGSRVIGRGRIKEVL